MLGQNHARIKLEPRLGTMEIFDFDFNLAFLPMLIWIFRVWSPTVHRQIGEPLILQIFNSWQNQEKILTKTFHLKKTVLNTLTTCFPMTGFIISVMCQDVWEVYLSFMTITIIPRIIFSNPTITKVHNISLMSDDWYIRHSETLEIIKMGN